jgi:hypothetical protein
VYNGSRNNFGYLCVVETLIIEGNDRFTVGNRYLE